MKLSTQEIAKAVGGYASTDIEISGVFTDSRKPLSGGLFVALEGENFDGHKFIESAVKSGAAAVMCKAVPPVNVPYILVQNTKTAYQSLAAYYRVKTGVKVIGITGSVGKTTTKDLTALCFSAKYETYKTQGNLNNDVGVPATLLSIEPCHDAAIVEMGMNHSGEISLLTRIAAPDAAIITNVGITHIENLGSRENILKAKLEILEGMKTGSPLIINADNDMLSCADIQGFRLIKCSLEQEADVYAENIIESAEGSEFDVYVLGHKGHVKLPVAGRHNIMNSLLALGAGAAFDIHLNDMCNALCLYTPSGMRQRINVVKGITFIEDCYNASPDSVNAALSVLKNLPVKRRIAVLGDMLELGDIAEKSHALIGEAAVNNNVDILLTYGEMTRHTAEKAKELGLKEVYSFNDHDSLAKKLFETVKPNDGVLFKGSRGMKLETAMNKLYEMLGE